MAGRGYILNEGDAKRLREIDDAVSDLTGGRYVGRRTRRPKRGGAGGPITGQFLITDNGDNTLDIAVGRVINGTTVTTVGVESALDVTGSSYVSIEIWYNVTWQTAYLAEATYPTQAKKTPGDYWTLRVLIAEKVDGVWEQRWHQEIHNTRVVKD